MKGLSSSTSSGVGDDVLGEDDLGSSEGAVNVVVDAGLSSVSHNSHRFILGWFIKVQTGQVFSVGADATDGADAADSPELGVVICILAGLSTPQSWHFSISSVFWNEQIGHNQVDTGLLTTVSGVEGDGARALLKYTVILADLLKNPAYSSRVRNTA